MDFDSGYWQEPDYLLTDLVSLMTNKGGMQLGVTLLVKGTVLTGTLIGERDYLAAMSETFVSQAKKSIPSPTKEDLKAIEEAFDFKTLTEDTYPEDLDNEDFDEEDEDFDPEDMGLSPVRHLHLKDPTILLPQPSITFAHGEFSMMRIRLTAVDGWMLGRAAIVEDNGPSAEVWH